MVRRNGVAQKMRGGLGLRESSWGDCLALSSSRGRRRATREESFAWLIFRKLRLPQELAPHLFLVGCPGFTGPVPQPVSMSWPHPSEQLCGVQANSARI